MSQQYPSLSLESTFTDKSGSTPATMNIKAYELKGFMFSMLTMCLKQTDTNAIEQQLTIELAKLPDFFREPLVVDLHEVSLVNAVPDFHALFTMMHSLSLTPVGVCNGSEAQKAAAQAVGIPVLQGGAATKKRPPVSNSKEQETPQRQAEIAPAQNNKPQAAEAEVPATHIVDTPVRTGQRVFSKGDLTLLAGVNAGAEALAAGSIHVYGPLRGRALAGVTGDRKARIFTKCMEAELVSIAGSFRVLENELGQDVQGKPAQIYLEGERIIIKPL
ncbi:MAG: septum site-determining protein MinC [Pseudomonadota bacterium]